MQKNTASQRLYIYAHDTAADAPKTGDAANLTARISKDGAAAAATNDTNPTELDATHQPGVYFFDLTQAETNANEIVVCAKSSTADVLCDPVVVYTRPANFPALGIESDGDLTKVNALDGHTAQTGDAYARLGAPAGVSIAADVATRASQSSVDTIDGIADAILVDTNELQTNQGNWVTATGFSTLTASDVRGAVGLASADLDTQLDAIGTMVGDIPTNAELATALAGADDAVLAAIVALNNLSAAQVNAEVDAALADVGLTSTITGRIDAAISTRLAAAGYTAPDNATISSIASAIAARLVGTIASGTHTAQSGDAYARLGAPAGASVSADIADLPTNAELATALSGIGGGSAPTAEQIADAVWDEALSGHATAGSAGAAMSAASASGDPWATVVPGDYDDGTAGAALGRLNNTPADAPVLVIPDPAEEADLCTVYLYTEALDNTKRAGIAVSFSLANVPTKSERALEVNAHASLVTDEDGYGAVTLQRTDLMEPAGRKYLVSSAALGIRNVELELTTDLYNLADLIG